LGFNTGLLIPYPISWIVNVWVGMIVAFLVGGAGYIVFATAETDEASAPPDFDIGQIGPFPIYRPRSLFKVYKVDSRWKCITWEW